jgi:hypothetical protein
MHRDSSGLADLKTRSREVRPMAGRCKVASNRLLQETEQLVEASKACLARSRQTLDRLRELDRPVHARRHAGKRPSGARCLSPQSAYNGRIKLPFGSARHRF